MPGSVVSPLLTLSQWPYENYTVSIPISWMRKLGFKEGNVLRAEAETWGSRLAVQCSPCISILAAPLWTLSEDAGRRSARSLSSLSCLGSTHAGSGLGVCRAASVAGHWPCHLAGGTRRWSPIGGAQARVRSLPRQPCGLWSSYAVLPVSSFRAWEEPRIQPLLPSWSRPPLSQA